MRKMKTPNAESSNALDSFQPGTIAEISLVAATAFAFPPEDAFPLGGRFIFVIPAGAVVRMHTAADGPGFQLVPGSICDFSFDTHSEKLFLAEDDISFVVCANKEVA